MTSIGPNHATTRCVLDTITTIEKKKIQEINYLLFTLVGMLHTQGLFGLHFHHLELKLTHLSKSLRIFVM